MTVCVHPTDVRKETGEEKVKREMGVSCVQML